MVSLVGERKRPLVVRIGAVARLTSSVAAAKAMTDAWEVGLDAAAASAAIVVAAVVDVVVLRLLCPLLLAGSFRQTQCAQAPFTVPTMRKVQPRSSQGGQPGPKTGSTQNLALVSNSILRQS